MISDDVLVNFYSIFLSLSLDIFNYRRERANNRRSSGNWKDDRLTWKEKKEYKIRMQRIAEQANQRSLFNKKPPL